MSVRTAARAGLVACAVLAAAGGAYLATGGDDGEWAPLGPYSTQRIVSRLEDPAIRGVWANGVVIVLSERCSSEDVTVVSVTSWVSVDPPGSVVAIGQGVGVRTEGCAEEQWRNPVPLEVAQRTEDEGGRMTWRITGTETPYDAAGRPGVTATWMTEPFAVASPQPERG